MAPASTKVIAQIIIHRRHNENSKIKKEKIVDILFTKREQNVYSALYVSNLYINKIK